MSFVEYLIPMGLLFKTKSWTVGAISAASILIKSAKRWSLQCTVHKTKDLKLNHSWMSLRKTTLHNNCSVTLYIRWWQGFSTILSSGIRFATNYFPHYVIKHCQLSWFKKVKYLYSDRSAYSKNFKWPLVSEVMNYHDGLTYSSAWNYLCILPEFCLGQTTDSNCSLTEAKPCLPQPKASFSPRLISAVVMWGQVFNRLLFTLFHKMTSVLECDTTRLIRAWNLI